MTTPRKLRLIRRLTITLLAAAMTLPGAASLAADKGENAATDGRGDRPMVIAHRGGALLRPENTLSAFRHAHDLGAEILEFDMLMTADDQVAVYHDPTINPDFCRPDEGADAASRPVRAMTLAEVRQLDCGSGVRPIYAGPRYMTVAGARVPTLDEVFGAFRDTGAMFFAETKVPKSMDGVVDVDPVLFAARLNDAVVKYGLEDKVILQSFDYRTIDALHDINPRIRTCLLGAHRHTDDYLALLRQHNASCIVLGTDRVTPDQLRELQQAGMLVYSDVIDSAEEWRRYAELGFDAIFTNDPAGAIDYLD